MKTVVMVLALLLVVATPVFAQDGVAFGWDDGLAGKIFLNSLSIEGVVDFWNYSPENDNLDSTTSLGLAGYVAAPIVNMGESKLCWFGGVRLLSETDWDMDIALRGGLQHDVMVTNKVSVSGKAGLELDMIGGVDGVDNSGATNIGTYGSIGIFWHVD